MRDRKEPGLETLLKRKEIGRSKPTTDSFVKELDVATSDLEDAKQSLKTGNYKWATIQAFHSMLHAARALLYRMGYDEKSDRALIAALHHLYEREIVGEMLDDLSNALTLTEQLQEGRTISKSSAGTALENATDFLEQAARILAAPREWFERHPQHRRRAVRR